MCAAQGIAATDSADRIRGFVEDGPVGRWIVSLKRRLSRRPLQDSAALWMEVSGPDHPSTVIAQQQLARALEGQSQHQEAWAIRRQAGLEELFWGG